MITSSPYLALRDWIHESYLSLCSVLAIAAMLLPILVLHGVHTGVIERMRENLMKDPAVLVLIPVGTKGAGFTEKFIEKIAKQPSVTFVIGRTRDIAAEILLTKGQEKQLTVSLEATADKDPLMIRYNIPIPQVSQNKIEMVLSYSAAQKLNISAGTTLTASMSRRLSTGKLQRKKMDIYITAVLPQQAESRDAGFTQQSFLNAVQDYRDSITTDLLQEKGETDPPSERFYEGFRVYVNSIDQVQIMEKWFLQQDIYTKSRSREIAAIRSLDQTLFTVSMVIATATGIGFLAFMISTVYASVRRKRKMLGMLRLIGFSGFSLLVYPITQSLITGILGTGIAFCLYAFSAYGIDMLFSIKTGGWEICIIKPIHLLIIACCVEVLAILASWKSAFSASKIEPSLVIREL